MSSALSVAEETTDPFSGLLAHVSTWNGRPSAADCALRIERGRAQGCYDGMQLHSAFQPLFLARTMRPVAYEALLRARDGDGTAIPPQEAFERPATPEDIVCFDRLCRTVHAVNFAGQARPGELLFLNVNARHLLSVDGGTHGAAFETLLGHCGLTPAQVVLEILEAGIDDLGRLAEAVTAYQKRGYRIAIDDFGCRHSNFDRLWQLSPDVVKLDRSLILEATSNARARLILPKLVGIIHDLGGEVVCEGVETPEQHALAVNAGVDLLQGYHYARPAPDLQRRANGP